MELFKRKKLFETLASPVMAILAGLIVGVVFVLAAGENPFHAYSHLFQNAFGTINGLAQTFQLATPLMLTGISAVVAFRSGIFNIGMEGQLIFGALASVIVGYSLELPPIIHPIAAIGAGMAAGAAWAFIPGILKVKLQVNEVVVTIVMNFIAIRFLTYLVNFPLRAEGTHIAYTEVINPTAVLQPFVSGSRWGPGFFIALIAVAAAAAFLWKTTKGYEQRMTGTAPLFARYGGIKTGQAALRGMIISGALSGLAGTIEVLGVHRRLMDGFSIDLGFDGLMVAVLGQIHPVGVVLAGIFIAGLRVGSLSLEWLTEIPRQLGGGLVAMIILFLAGRELFSELLTFFKERFYRITQYRKRRGT